MKCSECEEQITATHEFVRGYCDACDRKKRTCVTARRNMVVRDVEDSSISTTIKAGEVGRVTGITNEYGSEKYVVHINGEDIYVPHKGFEELFSVRG